METNLSDDHVASFVQIRPHRVDDLEIVLLISLAVVLAQAPVKVDLYSESYCPGCQSYTTDELNDAVNCAAANGIMSLRIFPYGNAHETQNADGTWSFTCQHGVSECVGNMYEGCAIEHNGNNMEAGMIPSFWKYYYCSTASGNAGVASVAQNCASTSGLDWNTIETCATTSNPSQGSKDDGNPEMHTLAVTTDNLVPPHQWTPWVVLNGTPLNQAQLDESLLKMVCNAYTGTKPSCCNNAGIKVDMRNETLAN